MESRIINLLPFETLPPTNLYIENLLWSRNMTMKSTCEKCPLKTRISEGTSKQNCAMSRTRSILF